jgi:hypothetical protein
MPYSLELPLDEIDCWRLHRDLAKNSKDLCHDLLNPKMRYMETTPPEGKDYLLALSSADEKTIAWINTILGAVPSQGGKH